MARRLAAPDPATVSRGRHCSSLLLLGLLLGRAAASFEQSSSRQASLWLPRQIIQARELQRGRPAGLRALTGSRWEQALVAQPANGWATPNTSREPVEEQSDRWLDAKRARQAAYIVSPVSGRLLDVGERQWPLEEALQSGAEAGFAAFESLLALQNEPYQVKQAGRLYSPVTDECNTLRTSTQLTKDEVEPASGRLLRSCRGLVQVNRCEGSCGSSVQPAIKSPSGFKKHCACCNEGSFRKVRVRLAECYSALDNRRISSELEATRSFMDVEVEEPVDCKCRACDGTL